MKVSKLKKDDAIPLVDIAAEIEQDLKGIALTMFRTDAYFFPTLHCALRAIAFEEEFEPETFDSGQGNQSYSSDPQQALVEMLNRLEEYIDGLPDSEEWDQMDGEKVLGEMKNLHRGLTLAMLKPEVKLYRARNGELAIKFPERPDSATEFLNAFGAQTAQKLFSRYDTNPDTLYVTASIDPNNGQLKVNFPTDSVRELFCKLLNLDENLVIVSGTAISIKDRGILDAGYNVATTFSREQMTDSQQTTAATATAFSFGLLEHSVLFPVGVNAVYNPFITSVAGSPTSQAVHPSGDEPAAFDPFQTFIQPRS